MLNGVFVALVTPFDDDARVDLEAREAPRGRVPLFAEPSPAILKALLRDAGRIGSAAVRLPLAHASAASVELARAAFADAARE